MSGGNDIYRYARYAAETWTTPSQFASPQEFLEALTEVLDELAESCGMEPKPLEGVWS
jgi:hypothetical protein